MDKKPFIFTADKGTADQLKELGYELISEDSSGYTFYNCKKQDDKIADSNFQNMKFTYTNKLCI